MLLLLKFRPIFRYQEQINSKIEVEARTAFEQAQSSAKVQLDKFGAASEFPLFNEYEDYPINSIKRVLPGTTVKSDQELLSLLWLPKK